MTRSSPTTVPRSALSGEPPPAPSSPVSVVTPGGIVVHAVQTGWLRIKSAYRDPSGPELLRVPSILLGFSWTPWLPILAWIIEHREGLTLVDLGETARITDPDYLACDRMLKLFYARIVQFAISPEEEIVHQMRSLGMRPQDVRRIVLTHLHSSHTGGLAWFPDCEIIAPREDYPSGSNVLSCRLPKWFNPQFPEFRSDLFGMPWHSLSENDDLGIVATPGHTKGHQSVVLASGGLHYFFAGDLSFDSLQMQKQKVSPASEEPQLARETLRRVLQFCRSTPTVFLPSHDPNSTRRLANIALTR
jgi:Zn-dependent hydrolases, including glyoxylases